MQKKKKEVSKVFSNTLWILMGQGVQALLSFIFSVWTAKYLGPNNYGIINYVMSIIAIFSAISNLGFTTTLVKFLIQDEDSEGQILGTSIFCRLITSVISSVAIVIFLSVVRPNNLVVLLVGIFECAGFILQSFGVISQWFQAHLNSKVSVIISNISYFLISLIRFYFLKSQKTVEYFALISVIQYSFNAMAYIYSYKKYKGRKLSVSINRGLEMIKYSYHFIISDLVTTVYSQMDKIMLSTFMSDTSVGYYSVAYNLCNAWEFIVGSIFTSATPLIISDYNNDRELYKKHFKKTIIIVWYVALSISVFVIIFAKFIINILYGEQYYESILVLQIICWYTPFLYINRFRTIWLICENKQQYDKKIVTFGLICNLILNYFLIGLMGPSGAALATIITQIITGIITPLLISDIRDYVYMFFEAIIDVKEIKTTILGLMKGKLG